MKLKVKLTPRSSENTIVGFDANGVLRVKVCAPPVDNAANMALIELLGKKLGVPKSSVVIKSGLGSRTKTVELLGIDRINIGRKDG